MDSGEWKNVLNKIQRKGVLMDENVLMQSFTDVVNKAFDPDMGFGYISENGYKPKAKVILQGKNPFMDNHTVSADGVIMNAKVMLKYFRARSALLWKVTFLTARCIIWHGMGRGGLVAELYVF